MRISDWSADGCSSDLQRPSGCVGRRPGQRAEPGKQVGDGFLLEQSGVVAAPKLKMLGCLAVHHRNIRLGGLLGLVVDQGVAAAIAGLHRLVVGFRSEEHTSELQSLMRISYAVFCLKKNN